MPQTIEQSAAYLDHWPKALRGDKRLVVTAAAAAQRAVDHILGVTWDEVATPKPANDDLPGADVSDEDLDRMMETASPVQRERPPPSKHEVDPGRLEYGQWSHEFNETVGEGDIAASYCADTIALHNKARKPFVFQGAPWIVVSLAGNVAKAYRLVASDDAQTKAMSYGDKTRDCEAARADPDGFYHGVAVDYGKKRFVLNGPPALFVPGQVQQPSLFGDPAL